MENWRLKMTLDERIESCKWLIKNLPDIEEEGDFHEQYQDNKDYYYQMRYSIIATILNKILPAECIFSNNTAMFESDIYNIDYDLDNYFKHSKTWEYNCFNEDYCEELKKLCLAAKGIKDYTLCRAIKGYFGEDIKKIVYEQLEKDYPTITQNRSIMELIYGNASYVDVLEPGYDFRDEENFYINILKNSKLKMLIEENYVDKIYLSGLDEPMILYPYHYVSCSSDDYSLVAWLTGYSAYISGNTLTMMYLGVKFLTTLVYVDLAYEKYVKDKKL